MLAWSICAVTVVAWAVFRLVIFQETIMPLTYALPLLICVWTKDRRMLWGMAAVFAVMASIKQWVILPEAALPTHLDWAVYLTTLVNISVAAVVVHVIIGLREYLERKNAALAELNAQLAKSNAELETANEELVAREEEITRQNEELQIQSGELEQQNEELRSQGEELEQQTEELTGQAEELEAANDELTQREEVLQVLLSANHVLAAEAEVLSRVCREGLKLFGQDVIGAAVMEARENMLHVRAHCGVKTTGQALMCWPLEQSLPGW